MFSFDDRPSSGRSSLLATLGEARAHNNTTSVLTTHTQPKKKTPVILSRMEHGRHAEKEKCRRTGDKMLPARRRMLEQQQRRQEKERGQRHTADATASSSVPPQMKPGVPIHFKPTKPLREYSSGTRQARTNTEHEHGRFVTGV